MENESVLKTDTTAKEASFAGPGNPDIKVIPQGDVKIVSQAPPLPRREELPPLAIHEDRGSGLLRGVAFLAIVALLGFAAYKYGRPMLEQHRALLARIPHLEQSFSAVDHRLKAAEDKVQTLTGDRDAIASRVATLESKAAATLQSARKQTQELVSQAQQRMQAELDSRSQVVDARLGKIESRQEVESQSLASIQTELASTRAQVASQSRQISALQQEAGRNMDQVGRQLARLDSDTRLDRRNLDSVSAQVGRRRIDFEASKNHLSELAPGVELEITRTDVSNRRVDGWLWLLPDRRTVWVRGQSSQSPIVFYTRDDNRPRELVITRVTKNSVVGYLLVPARAAAGESVASSAAPSGAERAAE